MLHNLSRKPIQFASLLLAPALMWLVACSGTNNPPAPNPTPPPATAEPVERDGPDATPVTLIAPTIAAAAATAEPPGTPAPIEPTAAPAAALPAPVCDGLTEPNALGPYYTPDTPERTSLLEPGMEGERLVVTGYVLSRDCRPIPGAWLDFWHADANGEYDNEGYRLRGHQFTDENGRYTLETIVPGLYPGRTRHIHVALQAPGGEPFVTQLYFPGEPQNATDGLYLPGLEMVITSEGDGKAGAFDFVLDVE